jgi:hypothetical protein
LRGLHGFLPSGCWFVSVARHGRLVDLDEQVRDVQRSLVEFDSGVRHNVAIIGEPLAGKTSLVDAVLARYGKPVRSVRLTEIASDADHLPAMAGPEKIIAVDDCQYLFLRHIGGFRALEKFLEAVASSDVLYITAWNRFAWDYLEQVFDLRDYFPATVTIPALAADDIVSLIGARYELDKIRFIDDGGGNDLLTAIKPGLTGHDGALRTEPNDVRRFAFEKITRLSHGNPGVALDLWQQAYHDGAVRVSEISVPDYEVDLSPDEAFVTGNILMMKSLTDDDLMKIVIGHLRMDRILYVLRNRGLIRKVADRYSVEPAALYEIIESLKKSRQVW